MNEGGLLFENAHPPLPYGVRPGLRRIVALVALKPTLGEALDVAELLDMRDLNERELAWLEGLSVRTIRDWRQTVGKGPPYRNQGGIRYPIREYVAWRERGLQTGTAQGVRRGRRRA